MSRALVFLLKPLTSLLLAFHPFLAFRAKLQPYPGWHMGSWASDSGIHRRVIKEEVWKHCKGRRVIPWWNDLCVYVYPGNETSRALLLSGLYEPNEFYWLSSNLMPGQTFIDVGANMGLYTIFAARKVGSSGAVIAIEPSTRDFARLKANVELNKLVNVQLLQVALSDHEGEAELLVATEEHSGHNTLGDFGYATASQGTERVHVTRLDDIVKQLALTRIDVIKIDVEGAEYVTLRGAEDTLRRFKPSILLEISDRTLVHQGASGSKVWDFLIQRGYSIRVFHKKTGLPSQEVKPSYFDSENAIATRDNSTHTNEMTQRGRSKTFATLRLGYAVSGPDDGMRRIRTACSTDHWCRVITRPARG